MMKLDLDRFPRIALCHRPTPLEPMKRLSEHLGGPQLFIKRDDCTGLAFGGNKTRKLEFLMADAIEKGADTVITTGGPQSNHARQTAAAAARLGLKCELVLPHSSRWHSPMYDTNGNALLDRLLGAKVHIVADGDAARQKIAERSQEVRSNGGKPYFIPTGGSTPIGALGYVAAAAELVEQADSRGLTIDYMVVATGSCTTHAGIVTGLEALARREQVIGITISLPDEALKRREPVAGKTISPGGDGATATVRQKARQTAELLGMPVGSLDERVTVNADYLGPGYGEPTEGMIEAVRLTAQMEGILLDPVYTGKTMAGLIDLVRQGFFQAGQNIVFWHTGGTPALFPYEPLFPVDTEDGGSEAR